MEDLIRQKISFTQPLIMSWHGLGNSLSIEIAGSAGYHAALLDHQHGSGDINELMSCIVAADNAHLPSFVRTGWNDPYLITQALDAGAQGIVCPMIDTADQARALVEATKYPPLGSRSFGAFRAQLIHGKDYVKRANDWTITCAQIETQMAVDNLNQILDVCGLDMILVGPNDLALSLSDGSSRDIRDTAVLNILPQILQACREKDVIAGIYANDTEYCKFLIEMGWDIIGLGYDIQHIENGLRKDLKALEIPK